MNKEEFKELKEKAGQGCPEAQYNLGYAYCTGSGVTKNYKLAVEWFSKSALQGHANAQLGLSVCYKCGWGVEKNLKKAEEWYEKAAEQGKLSRRNLVDGKKEKNNEHERINNNSDVDINIPVGGSDNSAIPIKDIKNKGEIR